MAKYEDVAKYTGTKHEDLLHRGPFIDIKWILSSSVVVTFLFTKYIN